MFWALASILDSLNTFMLADAIGKAIARIADDYQRNRATAQRVAGMKDDRIGLIH